MRLLMGSPIDQIKWVQNLNRVNNWKHIQNWCKIQIEYVNVKYFWNYNKFEGKHIQNCCKIHIKHVYAEYFEIATNLKESIFILNIWGI